MLALRRTSAWEWRKFKVQTPAGHAAEIDMVPDKSGRQVEAGGCLRRLLKVFRASGSDGAAFTNYGQLTI